MKPVSRLAEAPATGARTIVRLPVAPRPLPQPADLEHVASLPLVQMFVVGRSGSGLIHAFLDGHPGVLHVPHTFKYYDFVASNPDLLSLGQEDVVNRFITSPLVPFLFESERSVIVGGRLGAEQRTYVQIDLAKFRAAFLSVTKGRPLTERLIFLAIVLAYGWCAGQDAAAARIVFHHVHHGDWLWPERLIEQGNYHPPLGKPSASILRADRYIVSLREPHDALASYLRFIEKLDLDPAQRLDVRERFLRLMMQDWLRLTWLERSGGDLRVIRIEDLRTGAATVMRDCARWLGLDADDPSLMRLSYYGFDWHGDIYTAPSRQVQPASAPFTMAWQERWFADLLLGGAAAAHGYRSAPGALERLRLALLQPLTVLMPSPLLENPTLRGWERYRAAVEAARRRVQFVAQFRMSEAAV